MFENRRLLFSHNKKSVSPIFLENLMLLAVAIKLSGVQGVWMSPFCGLLASFSLECGVAGAVLWGDVGAVPRGSFVWFAWDFPGCWGWADGLCLALGFIAVAAQTGVISLCSRTDGCCFLTIRRVYHQFFLKI